MNLLKSLVPQRIKDSFKVLFGYSNAVPQKNHTTENLFDCPVCGSKNVPFDSLPMHYFSELFENQHIHASFQAETINMEFYTCSRCGATDRERLYALYFQKSLEKNNKEWKVLDIAPAAPLNKYLKARKGLVVRTADLFMESVDDKVDLTNMFQYNNNSFDIFICSHVLEHIDDDIQAMKELYRVLKSGGWGIAMVPICLGLSEVYENNSIKDPAGRWKHFGQDDHVRMYSKQGFVERLESAGFTVLQCGKEFFGVDAFKKYGIHHRSILYIVSK